LLKMSANWKLVQIYVPGYLVNQSLNPICQTASDEVFLGPSDPHLRRRRYLIRTKVVVFLKYPKPFYSLPIANSF
jgi:hypothetical protein